MVNIIKAMNYQTRNDIFTVITFLLAFVVQAVSLFFTDEIISYTGSDVVVYLGNLVPVVCLILVLLMTCRICGWDYSDRTLNYELLSGHTRFQVFMGRIFTSILWCAGGFAVFSLFPVLIFTLINGWGYTVGLWAAMVRYALMFLLLLRMVAGFAMLTFIIRNGYGAMIFGYIVMGISTAGFYTLEDVTGLDGTPYICFMSMVQLFTFENCKNEFINGQDIPVFDGAISGSLLGGITGWSVLIIVVYLLIGYIVFRKRDLR